MAAFAKSGGEKGYSGSWKRLSMSTTVLAYLILFMGFITFLCGAFGLLMLLFEEVSKTERVIQILRDGGRTDIRRPCHDRYWAGPAAAAADPWQGVISMRNRKPYARLRADTRGREATFKKS
jgi:hypothetical protein